MNQNALWKELFVNQDQIRLALSVRQSGAFEATRTVRALADDQILLRGGASLAARLSKRPQPGDCRDPQCVIVTPEPGQSSADFDDLLAATRAEFPGAELAGYGPSSWTPQKMAFDRFVMKLGVVSEVYEVAEDFEQQLSVAHGVRVTGVLVYTPCVTPEALEEAVKAVEAAPQICSVVALPVGAGDRIPLPGLTTAGTTDMMVVSALRLLLPPNVGLRSSWAALGWKVAQLALLYGADELTGWTAAETRAYSGRVRAAARVENEELLLGIGEAGLQRVPWLTQKVGGRP
jgi:hypothetical protein